LPFSVVVEGAGDAHAVPNLLARLTLDLGLSAAWRPPIRINVLRPSDAQRVADLTRSRAGLNGLLVLRDDEDGCPAKDGPEMAKWFKDLGLPFPVACCLFFREYETLFLASLPELAGRDLVVRGVSRTGLPADASFTGDPERRRDPKSVLTGLLPAGRSYKETVDQLAFTQLLQFPELRQRALPCFETLERALQFLSGGAPPGSVFPLDR
jgi:hypothetical protein